MNKEKLLFLNHTIGLMAGIVFVSTLTGCIVVGRPVGSGRVSVTPVGAVVVAQDDYLYYPAYEIYYSPSLQQYVYLEGGVWVSRPAPAGFSIDVLFASPSVQTNFRDSPALHHAAVSRAYPKTWTPTASKQGQKKNQKKDDHGNDDGR